MSKLLSNSVASAEIQDATFSESVIDSAVNRSDIALEKDHIYVGSIPQIFHGEKNKQGRNSNRAIMFDVDPVTKVAQVINMPHSIMTSMFIAPASEWTKADRIPTDVRYLNNDPKKSYLRPDCMYTAVTEGGNVQFNGDAEKKTLGFTEPFALRCLGQIQTINARYNTSGAKLHGEITPLVTFDENEKTYAKIQGRRTYLFEKLEGDDLKAVLANVPTSKEEFKKALDASGEGEYYSKIEKYLL